MPKVSVVIPVYRVERYIERCARSLFEQTLEDMEFIFVDDCSKDNSISILKKIIESYPERKEQVRILYHRQNQGLPLARKTGVEAATGEYIAHCDSDDWVELDAYQKAYELAKINNYDLVIYGYARTDGNKIIYNQNPIYNEIANDKHLLVSSLLQGKDLSSLCNKLIRRELYLDKNFVFPTMNMWEDYPCVFQFFNLASRIGTISETFYWYYQNLESITGVCNPSLILNRLEQIKVNIKIIEDLSTKYGVYKEYSDDFIALKYKAKSELLPVIGKLSYWKEWFNTYSEVNSKILLTKSISLRGKIKYVVTLLGLYSCFSKLVNYKNHPAF